MQTNHNPPLRWHYRYENFTHALKLLQEAVTLHQTRPLSALEKEGMVQRFEYTWELAWKLMKDYLQHQGIVLEVITPAATIRAAFAATLIEHADGWMQALDARNKMSHTYNPETFERVIQQIERDFMPLLQQLKQRCEGLLIS